MKEKIFKYIQKNKEMFQEESETYNLNIFNEKLIDYVVSNSKNISGWPYFPNRFGSDFFDTEDCEIKYYENYVHIYCWDEDEPSVDFKIIFNPALNNCAFIAIDIMCNDPNRKSGLNKYEIFYQYLESLSLKDIYNKCLNWPLIGISNPIKLNISNCSISPEIYSLTNSIKVKTFKITSLNPKCDFYIWYYDDIYETRDKGLVAINIKTYN